MARLARQIASSGVYHVLLRSVPDRPLFLNQTEGAEFLSGLRAEKERDAMEIFAYCLTANAFHLVLKEGLSGVTAGVMRLARFWANTTNEKRNESGALFAGRFYSRPLESPEEILDATRFLHRLPLGFGEGMNYSLSSFKHYFKPSDLLSSEDVLALQGSQVDYRLYCDEECEIRFKG